MDLTSSPQKKGERQSYTYLDMSQVPEQSVLFLESKEHPRASLTHMLSNVRPETYGVTPPISKDGPSQQEIKLAADLINELKAQGTFEPEEEARKK